jgi:undecaprenyl diphosphate synthase
MSSLPEILSQLDLQKIPAHIAIIMDGNGRWAESHHFGHIRGHRAGVEAIRAATQLSAKLKINCLTLYAFSSENWNRPKEEVEALMELLVEFLEREVPTLKKNNIRFFTIGRTQGFPSQVQEKIFWAIGFTKECTGLILNLALNYGSRDELVDAFQAIASAGNLENINEKHIQDNLYTKDLPELDLLIRTSGEKRLSNFLLWQASYAELYFTDTLWPDFKEEDLALALLDYQSRNRRFGRR